MLNANFCAMPNTVPPTSLKDLVNNMQRDEKNGTEKKNRIFNLDFHLKRPSTVTHSNESS